ncbi:unnamed protein product [Mytilus coruscus]|uniref:Uncharacterized protein n=1 Tax=Mytilus coruscus TaxID=42192 RepID=A0A6J8EAG0_MYTCO|nr:unnamed protein product [Mytilus coruscus]
MFGNNHDNNCSQYDVLYRAALIPIEPDELSHPTQQEVKYDILAIHKVGQYVGCASLETVNPPFDEQTLKLLASEAFPKDEEHVKLLTELVSFMIGASVKSNYDHNQAIAKVVLTFERHRITSTKRSSNADGSVIKKFIFKDQQTTMRNVSLKTAGNFNPRDYLGENKKAPFYEPVLACLLQNTPANLENLYSQKVPLSQSPYEEPLDVMLFRFEKLIQIDQFMKDPSVKTKTCLLGAVILRKLIKLSTQVPEFPDMDKRIQMNLKEHLMNLLHAYNCQQQKINCNDQICKHLKYILTHMQSCTDGRLCKKTGKSQSPCRAGGRNKKLKLDNDRHYDSDECMIVMNVTARIEHEIFQQSSSQEEYLHLLLDRLYKIKADIEQPLLDADCKTDSEGNSKESLQQTDLDGPKAKKRRTLPDTSDEEIEEVNYEGLTENQLKYCQLYVSTRVLQTGYILNMNIMIQAIVFSGAFQAFELSNMSDSRTIGESSDNLKKELASKLLPKYQNQTIFQALSCLYSYGLQLCYGLPLTFTTFLVTYGGLSKEDKALLAIQALTESDRPLTDTETEEFNGDASDHYGKLMKVLFPTEYNRFHTELAEQFLVHIETVKDKAFVTAAVEHFMDHFYRFPGAHHRTILLDLVIKFLKEKWISRSDKYYHSYATKMYQMLKRLLDSSSGFAETITVLLLENWSCVCKYFMPKDIKDILKDIEKVVESNVFKETDQLLKLVETYLLEECVHDIECGH